MVQYRRREEIRILQITSVIRNKMLTPKKFKYLPVARTHPECEDIPVLSTCTTCVEKKIFCCQLTKFSFTLFKLNYFPCKKIQKKKTETRTSRISNEKILTSSTCTLYCSTCTTCLQKKLYVYCQLAKKKFSSF